MSKKGLSEEERMEHRPKWNKSGGHLDIWVKRVTFSGKNKYKECAWCVEGVSRRAVCQEERKEWKRDENGRMIWSPSHRAW